MIDALPPAAVFIGAALVLPVLRGRLKSAFMLLAPAVCFWILIRTPEGTHWAVPVSGHILVLGHIDRLSLVFGYIFVIVSFIALVFSLNVKGNLEHSAGLVYAGGALGVTFAGDFFSLYVFWEIMAVASTFLVLARRTVRPGPRRCATSSFTWWGAFCFWPESCCAWPGPGTRPSAPWVWTGPTPG